ncbi:hypothetical protein LEP1GSC047_3251 [Leptospira inadai serovar Lyme str. 10]|uniref:Uncharacterized protein n=1 Tax=Leptospira inadai serovar Lyme str. 10 TaxID=1049790 RepID=V6HUY9_9LEPT|nr:hypothetical protein LEP1GSC047_3251 [Leptospira inadai serovar Lyme str. 10]
MEFHRTGIRRNLRKDQPFLGIVIRLSIDRYKKGGTFVPPPSLFRFGGFSKFRSGV